jgi:hypothetical protein
MDLRSALFGQFSVDVFYHSEIKNAFQWYVCRELCFSATSLGFWNRNRLNNWSHKNLDMRVSRSENLHPFGALDIAGEAILRFLAIQS